MARHSGGRKPGPGRTFRLDIVKYQQPGYLAEHEKRAQGLIIKREIGREIDTETGPSNPGEIDGNGRGAGIDEECPTGIISATAPPELTRELVFADAWRSVQDHDVVSLRVAKALGDPVEQVVAAQKWQVAARLNIALEMPKRSSGSACRNLRCDGVSCDVALEPYYRCSGWARVHRCQDFSAGGPTLIGPVLKVPLTSASRKRAPVPSVTEIEPSRTSSASRRPMSRPTGACCFNAAISRSARERRKACSSVD